MQKIYLQNKRNSSAQLFGGIKQPMHPKQHLAHYIVHYSVTKPYNSLVFTQCIENTHNALWCLNTSYIVSNVWFGTWPQWTDGDLYSDLGTHLQWTDVSLVSKDSRQFGTCPQWTKGGLYSV